MISHPLITPIIKNVTTSKGPSSRYTFCWKEILDLAENGLVKLKCPENFDPVTTKPYTEGRFVQCLQCFEAPVISSGYINIHTPQYQNYWYQHENWMTHKLTVQINEHNEELVKKGVNKRQRKNGIHAFVVVKKKIKIVSDIEDDKNSE